MMHITLTLPLGAWEYAVDWQEVAKFSIIDEELEEGSLIQIATDIRNEASRIEYQYNLPDRLPQKMRKATDMIEEWLLKITSKESI